MRALEVRGSTFFSSVGFFMLCFRADTVFPTVPLSTKKIIVILRNIG